MIVNTWGPEFTKLYSHLWPRTYCCLDSEYCGNNAEKDLIVEIGHCIVEDGHVIDQASFILDWTKSDIVPRRWLEASISRIQSRMGDGWKITVPVMEEQGLEPIKVLSFYYDLFKTWSKRGLPFVAHNGYSADERMLAGAFEGFLSKRFTFGDNSLFDTGAVHKASLIMADRKAFSASIVAKMQPGPTDTLRSYFKRVTGSIVKGVKWNLGDCLKYYDLTSKYVLDDASFHSAGFDSYCTHLLMEEYFKKITHNNSDSAGFESPQALERMFHEQIAKADISAVAQAEEKIKKMEDFNSLYSNRPTPEARAKLNEMRQRKRGQRAI